MSDLIDTFVAELRASVPDIEVTIDRSDDPAGESFIDIKDQAAVWQVSFRPSVGFGLYAGNGGFGRQPHEVVAVPRTAAARFLDLCTTESMGASRSQVPAASLERLEGLPCFRMNGVGNAIVVLDLRGSALVLTAAEARAINVRPGLAFDQLMAIHDAQEPETDGYIRIYNTDGSLSGACGNGTRCVAWVMLRDDGREQLRLTTHNSHLDCRRIDATRFSVDMGPPTFRWDEIPLRDATLDPQAVALGLDEAPFGAPFAVGIGNPHAVFFVPDADAVDLLRLGPPVEHASAFPERANVSFAEIVNPAEIKLRVWERGAGATLGCGSGACASLVAAAVTGRTGRRAVVDLPGGRLEIDWRDDGHVIMTGPVELEFEAVLGDPSIGIGTRAA